MLETHHAKSLLAYKLNNLNEAEKFCRLGMEILAAQDDYNLPPSLRMQLVKPFFALATKIYEAKKDYAQALKYERLHNEIVREQTSLSRYEAIRNMEFSFELEKKETEKATIQKEAEQYRLVVGLQGGVIALVVIVFALLTVSLRNRRKRLAMELENTRLKAEESEHEKDQLIFRVVHSKFIPHFTGNVLNSINYLISRDPKRAQKYVADYAVFSARTLVNIDKVCQALHEEVEYVRVYLTLEKLRFEDRLEYTITIAPEVDTDITVPVMILHTFCENAFKHGLRHKPGTWKLDIDVTATDGCTVIALTDNGVGRERAKALNTGGTGAGLKIVEQQIQLFNRQYGKHSFMKITDLYNEQKKPSGTRFELVIKN
jgi:LytS/YehU family sensor histidine kinase